MDTIETLGSTEYAMNRAMIRIDSIGTAKTAAEALYQFAAVTGYITAVTELNAITHHARAILLELANTAYDDNLLAEGKARYFLPR